MRLTAAIAAGCAVHGVPVVSTFAQSDTAFRRTAAVERSADGVLRTYVESRVALVAMAALPANFVAPRIYRGLLESMLQGSPTFRRQCLRIAHEADLIVQLETNFVAPPADVRARTHIARHGRTLIAVIQLLRLDDAAELVAHELEHVIEQLDGVDLRARAALGSSGVRRCPGDVPVFETVRAVRVGRAVAAELRGGA